MAGKLTTDLIRIAILDEDNKRTVLRALPKAEIIDVRGFWGEKRGRNPKRWNILYDERIVQDHFQVRQIVPLGKKEVVLLMRRKKRNKG